MGRMASSSELQKWSQILMGRMFMCFKKFTGISGVQGWETSASQFCVCESVVLKTNSYPLCRSGLVETDT